MQLNIHLAVFSSFNQPVCLLQYPCIPGQSRTRAELFQGGGEDLGTGMPPVPRAGHGMKEWTHKTVIAVWQLRSFCVRTQK